MSGYRTKIYVVQRATGEVIAAKTAFDPAHQIAKAEAPCRILFAVADKTVSINVTDYDPDQARAINCKVKP
jgi:hypothetical protein